MSMLAAGTSQMLRKKEMSKITLRRWYWQYGKCHSPEPEMPQASAKKLQQHLGTFSSLTWWDHTRAHAFFAADIRFWVFCRNKTTFWHFWNNLSSMWKMGGQSLWRSSGTLYLWVYGQRWGKSRIKGGQRVVNVLKLGQKVVNVWINDKSKCGQCVKERSMCG